MTGALKSLRGPSLSALVGALLGWACWSWAPGARAQAASPPAADKAEPAAAPAKLPPYHHSVFSWEHHVSTETVGIGDDPQSSNPTYTMGLAAKTRYYLNDEPGRLLSVRLDGGLYREFTDSDSTTQRGEWSFSDTSLALVYAHRFLGPSDLDGTFVELRPLTLLLPTSRNSFESGRYFAPGVLVGLTNIRPILAGRAEPDILSTVRLAVGYERWFARATVPTNESLNRVRLTPEGRSVGGDQLSGSSLTRDQITASARIRFDFGEAVVWTTDFGVQPAWKYDLQDDVQLCGTVSTGCTTVDVSGDDSRHIVSTQFNTEVSVSLVKSLSLDFGYGNSSNQLGQDGRRRNLFYSPSAEFYVALSFQPHELAPPSKQTATRTLSPHSL
jgi:hypothetical protein